MAADYPASTNSARIRMAKPQAQLNALDGNQPKRDMQTLLMIKNQSCQDDLAAQLATFGFNVDCLDEFDSGAAENCHAIIVDLECNLAAYTDTIRTIRAQTDHPLVVLSGDGGVTECVVALELGADTYIRKPVVVQELAARIRALLRRVTESAKPAEDTVLRTGDVELDPNSRIVRLAGSPVHLTAVEFDLLNVLMASAGKLVTRDAISRTVFRRVSARSRSIDVHMSGLRKKLGDQHDGTVRIRTVRGYGYIFMNGDH